MWTIKLLARLPDWCNEVDEIKRLVSIVQLAIKIVTKLKGF